MSENNYFQDEEQVEDVGFRKRVGIVKDDDDENVELLQMPDLCLMVVLGKN